MMTWPRGGVRAVLLVLAALDTVGQGLHADIPLGTQDICGDGDSVQAR